MGEVTDTEIFPDIRESVRRLCADFPGKYCKGLTIRPIRTMLNHATTELFFDDLKVLVLPANGVICSYLHHNFAETDANR